MKLQALKDGKFSAKVLNPEIANLVSGGRTFETDHFESGRKDTSNYHRCGDASLYDMTVTLDTGRVVIDGVSTEMWKGTTAWWYE